MSWNRLLGYMIKSGSLLSANQPSCHPVKQTLNRFFGCMPRAACQPDMWTFTKKRIPCPSLLPNVTFFSRFVLFFTLCFYMFSVPSCHPYLKQINIFPPPMILVSHPVLLSSDKVALLPGWDQSPGLNGVAVWGESGAQSAWSAAELCIYYLFQNRAHT